MLFHDKNLNPHTTRIVALIQSIVYATCIPFDLIQFNSIQFNSIQFNSIQNKTDSGQFTAKR